MGSSGGKMKSVMMLEVERLQKELERFKVMLQDAEEGKVERESFKLWLQQLKDVISHTEDLLDGEGEKHMPSMEEEVDATTAHSGGKDMSATVEIETLQTKLKRFKAMHRDAEQVKVKSDVFKLWLQELKIVIYDAEDLLDEFEHEDLRCRVEHQSFLESGERSSPCASVVVPFDPEILARRRDNIWRRFEEVEKNNQSNFYLKYQMGDQSSKLDVKVKESSSFMTDLEVYGRDETKSELIRMLTVENTEGEESSSSVESGGLPVICVTGIGGIGKTTLAQYVYNDGAVQRHFPLRMWVHVSPSFDMTALTKKVLEHVDGPQNVESLNVLQRCMSERLKDKRFLLVLDDMWEESHDKWSTFIAPLISVVGSGSRILVTTRNMGVADAVRSVMNISLEPLTCDDSWLIFKRHAFPDGESDVRYSELQSIGKRIVQKLKGHPLAASTMGGLLRLESDESYWRNIMESKLWKLERENDRILPALRISYEYLPPELKLCFTYLSVLRKGRKFEIIDLVQLWMAQGYLSPKQKVSMEDVGMRYLDDLIKRSLIQFVNGRYVVHDLLHDLGRHILQNDCYEIGPNEIMEIPAETYSIRHLYVDYQRSFYENLQVICEFKQLRTLSFAFSEFRYVRFSQTLFYEIKHLRVLDLSGSTLVCLPNSISCLNSLRYLDLRDTKIKILPDSLCTLYKLQTLKLTGCDELSTLPKYISNLLNLHYLEVRSELVCNISRIGNLIHLQSLEVLSISKEAGNKISALKMMNELQGKLRIINLQNVETKEESVEATLKKKQYLNVLEMVWAKDRNFDKVDPSFEESIIECLEPPAQLKELVIDGYIGVKVPNWMIDSSISRLQSLHLTNCPKLEKLPTLEGLKCIKLLSIESCNQLQELPQLPQTITDLCLKDVGLTLLPSNLHVLTLEKLILHRISQLVEQPLLPVTLKELTLSELPLKSLPKFYLHSEYHHEQIIALTDEDQISNYEPPELLVLRISNCRELTTLHDGILKHHMKHLQELSIVNCRELIDWPKGDAFQATVSSLNGELTIENCAKLKALPEGIKLHPSLKKLTVRGCPKISNKSLFSQMQNIVSTDVSLGTEYENLQSCIEEALQQPLIVDQLFITCSDEAMFSPYISLDYSLVKIFSPKQRANYQGRRLRLEMKSFSHQLLHACLDRRHTWASSLRKLNLDGIPDNAFSGDRQHHIPPIHLPSLESLVMWNCMDMRMLPLKMLLSGSLALHTLALDNCPELTLSSIVEGIRSIPSLLKLQIYGRPKLEQVSSNDVCCHKINDDTPSCLPKLKEIITDNTELLTWLPTHDDIDKTNNSDQALFRGHIIGSLRTLRLRFSGVSWLSTAEEEGLMAVATSLQFLSLWNCKDLKKLPANLRDLVPNLKVLFIEGCPCIQHLPDGGFPMSLEVLSIKECPDLAQWCYIHQEDMTTIRRIPVLWVDGRFLQGSYVKYVELRAKWDFDP